MAAGGGAAAAAAAAAAARARRIKIIRELTDMSEPIKCPLCSSGKLVPLFSSSSTNWVCVEPECNYMIHQHGTSNTKVWKGTAAKDDRDSHGNWITSP